MTGDTNTTRLVRAHRVILVPLVCITLLACGGSSGTTAATPVTPAPATVNCNLGATARDGTRYTDRSGAPNCLAHLHAEVDNLQGSGDIPSNARGNAFILDFLFQRPDDDDMLELYNAGGLDDNGNYFLTTGTHPRLDLTYHGSLVRLVYNAFSPVLPAAFLSFELANAGTSANPDLEPSYSADQVRLAYTTARGDNPLITGSAASSPYQAHKAIYNFSFTGSHALLLSVANDLSSLSGFTAASSRSGIPTGIIVVAGLGNSDHNWSSGFRKEPQALLLAGYFVDSLSDSNLATRIDDTPDDLDWLDGVYADSVELDTDLTDLIASTSTTQLAALVEHSSWRTPDTSISSAFPNISSTLATKVSEAGQTRLNLQRSHEISLLDLLAIATVQARTGHYYTASYFNSAGNDHRFNTHCGVLRDGCFILPFYGSDDLQGTSFAAPRLTAVIDSLWLIWPNLTHLDMHRLLRTCAADRGAPGVDPVFGQGLLDLECLVQPSGGLQIPTAQVAGIERLLDRSFHFRYWPSNPRRFWTAFQLHGRDEQQPTY